MRRRAWHWAHIAELATLRLVVQHVGRLEVPMEDWRRARVEVGTAGEDVEERGEHPAVEIAHACMHAGWVGRGGARWGEVRRGDGEATGSEGTGTRGTSEGRCAEITHLRARDRTLKILLSLLLLHIYRR